MATTFTEAFRAERQAISTNGHRTRKSRTPILVHLSRLGVAGARLAARRLPQWQQARTAVLSTTAFGACTWAAWVTDARLGAVVGGVSLLILEALSGDTRR